MPIFRVKSVKIYIGQKNLHWRRRPRRRQLSGMKELRFNSGPEEVDFNPWPRPSHDWQNVTLLCALAHLLGGGLCNGNAIIGRHLIVNIWVTWPIYRNPDLIAFIALFGLNRAIIQFIHISWGFNIRGASYGQNETIVFRLCQMISHWISLTRIQDIDHDLARTTFYKNRPYLELLEFIQI